MILKYLKVITYVIILSFFYFKKIDIGYSEENGIVFGNTLAQEAIAGIEKHLSDFLIFYAPTVNSYKRFK